MGPKRDHPCYVLGGGALGTTSYIHAGFLMDESLVIMGDKWGTHNCMWLLMVAHGCPRTEKPLIPCIVKNRVSDTDCCFVSGRLDWI